MTVPSFGNLSQWEVIYVSDKIPTPPEALYRHSQTSQKIAEVVSRLNEKMGPIYNQIDTFNKFQDSVRIVAESSNRIYNSVRPDFVAASMAAANITDTLNRFGSIFANLPATSRFISLLGGESFPEYSDDLINAVILETEEYCQGLPDIEDYGYDSETQEAENLIEKVFNDIQNVTSFDVNKSYVCEIPDPVLKIARDLLVSALVVKIYQFFSGQLEYDVMVIGVRVILEALNFIFK